MLAHFKLFADYNKWANGRLFDSCAQLSESEYKKKRESFFGSIHNTLNHLMVGDTIWTSRMHGTSPSIALNAELFTNFDELRAAREKMDDEIVAYMQSRTEADIAGDVEYKTTSGDPHSMSLATILAHFFNHQTHHRAQVHDMLSQTPIEPPVLDLLYFIRD